MKFLFFLLLITIFSCNSINREDHSSEKKLFTLLTAETTGIDFANILRYTEEFNVYTYRSFYNGAGVGLGDINNDGLVDIYFCGNQVSNKLYLNQGDFKFKDITESAGLSSLGVWSTGVSMVDINGDGLLDIYVCKSGSPSGKKRNNELFINNGNLTFTERSEEFGINDKGLSTHAVFFDYDKDGDLDCYLLNNSFRSVGNYDLRINQRQQRDSLGGNKLYRNDNNYYKDVSNYAGIYGSAIGFGLGVTVGDVNKDGWEDIYVSNDFFERDYLYLNNKDGTFRESLEKQIEEISLGSMGADMADINNDGYPEIFVTEMLPATEARLKTKISFENWEKYKLNIRNGYYHQFPRNVLQLNNGDNTFSEIGRFANVSATDWSWGALIADLNNDGFKDIFVANGIYKDLLDQDYVNFMANPITVSEILKRDKSVITRLVDSIPSEPLANFAFENQKNLTFINRAKEWGLDKLSFSNGSVYGDLDNDGDLDLVVNNVNMPSFIYRNNSEKDSLNNNYLKFNLIGTGHNRFALGTQITLKHKGNIFYQELAPMRGFQSTVDCRINIGLGNISIIDTVSILWPDLKTTILTNVSANQQLTVNQKDSKEIVSEKKKEFKKIFKETTLPSTLHHKHEENDFSDFDRDRLIPHMISVEGPKTCIGDVNGDNREDLYIGGAKDQPGSLYIQTENNQFKKANQKIFEQDRVSEDTGCIFFDADMDGDLDLYVGSGGNEFPSSSSALINRLYFNNGKGNFIKSTQLLPTNTFESVSTVKACDYDSDGDQDLFVGVRLKPFFYGMPVNGYILNNDGKGSFTNVTNKIAPSLNKVGMITDAVWADIDGDKDNDLILVGEWMPIKVFINDSGVFKENVEQTGLHKSNGWWNCIEANDIDDDGDIDFIVANHGLNSRFKADTDKPVSMFINDFDRNGTIEQIVTTYNGGKSYPISLRHDLVQQLPSLKKKYLKYASYQEQTLKDIFTTEQLDKTIELNAFNLKSAIIENKNDGSFQFKTLPNEAQFAPMYSILVDDFDKDGKKDILMGGNFYNAKPEVGIYGASYGVFLKGFGGMNFKFVSPESSGFFVKGQVRDIKKIKRGLHNSLIVAKNNGYVQIFDY